MSIQVVAFKENFLSYYICLGMSFIGLEQCNFYVCQQLDPRVLWDINRIPFKAITFLFLFAFVCSQSNSHDSKKFEALDTDVQD